MPLLSRAKLDACWNFVVQTYEHLKTLEFWGILFQSVALTWDMSNLINCWWPIALTWMLEYLTWCLNEYFIYFLISSTSLSFLMLLTARMLEFVICSFNMYACLYFSPSFLIDSISIIRWKFSTRSDLFGYCIKLHYL